MFGAGTACVVCPIDKILYMHQELHIPTMDNGPDVASRFYQELLDIQVTLRCATARVKVPSHCTEQFNYSR